MNVSGFCQILCAIVNVIFCETWANPNLYIKLWICRVARFYHDVPSKFNVVSNRNFLDCLFTKK